MNLALCAVLETNELAESVYLFKFDSPAPKKHLDWIIASGRIR